LLDPATPEDFFPPHVLLEDWLGRRVDLLMVKVLSETKARLMLPKVRYWYSPVLRRCGPFGKGSQEPHKPVPSGFRNVRISEFPSGGVSD